MSPMDGALFSVLKFLSQQCHYGRRMAGSEVVDSPHLPFPTMATVLTSFGRDLNLLHSQQDRASSASGLHH